jgi:prephenate dehydratase
LADVEAHPEEPGLARALEELAFFCKELKILGVYPAHPLRIESQMREREVSEQEENPRSIVPKCFT